MNRHIDKLGRLCLPKEMRKKLGINECGEVNMTIMDDKIILTNPNKFSIEKYIEELLEDTLYDNHKEVLNHLLYVIDKNK